MSKDPKIQTQSSKEFAEMVDQAVLEVEDLKAFINFDDEYVGGFDSVIMRLEKELNHLQTQLQNGKHEFIDEDLLFMEAVAETDAALLPFRSLLLRINAAHRKGVKGISINSG